MNRSTRKMKGLWKKEWLLFVFVISVLFATIFARSADARVVYDKESKQLQINGPTTWNQWREIDNALKEEVVLSVSIWGPGGEVQPALAIARIIRDANVPLIIPEQRLCVSACAFIASANKNKVIVEGEAWFHGPHKSHFLIIASPETYSRATSELNIRMAFLMQEWGYGKDFYRWMVFHTSACRFFAVKTTEDFNNLKERHHFSGSFVDQCPTQEQIIGAY